MMGEVVAFRHKRLSGFLPEEDQKPAEPIKDHRDTTPSEYTPPEQDPA